LADAGAVLIYQAIDEVAEPVLLDRRRGRLAEGFAPDVLLLVQVLRGDPVGQGEVRALIGGRARGRVGIVRRDCRRCDDRRAADGERDSRRPRKCSAPTKLLSSKTMNVRVPYVLPIAQ